MNKYLLMGVLTVGVLFFACGTQAAEEPVTVIDEDLEYTYGSVVSASPAEVLVTEYNYETDEEIQVPYVVNAETKFSNISAAADLVKGDNVDIYYKLVDGQKVATMITKDETVYEAEDDGGGPDGPPGNAVEPAANATEVPVTGNETRG